MPAKPDKNSTHRSVPGALLRAQAAQAIYDICEKDKLLDAVMQSCKEQLADDKAWFQELIYGTLRWYERLQAISEELLQKPFKKKDSDVQALLLLGLYQLLYMHIKDHAVLNTTVAAAELLKKPWAKNVLNACLRRFIREQQTIIAASEKSPEAQYSHPQWLLQRLQSDWPSVWQDIVRSNNQQAPMALRVNTMKISREAYRQKLHEAGQGADIISDTASGLLLKEAVNVEQLPGFESGLVSVQDSSAQLTVSFLDLSPHQQVLDACAAPGGKAAHILEHTNNQCQLTAVEISKKRYARLQENLHRLELKARLIQGDATQPNDWWDGTMFDRILLDAPCSATGVIRRHPDIKRHRKPEDIESLSQQQARLLDALWPLLKPGGKLLYVTCSVLTAENEDVINHFLARQGDVKVLSLALSWAIQKQVGLQILPGTKDSDGFYYALLQKIHMP
jgi:16S rRNA (cytosine967-C5)-methyltransferase